MLKKLTLTLLLAGALPLASRADDAIEIDGIRYILNPDDFTATVTYFSDYYGNPSNDGHYNGNITIPSEIYAYCEDYYGYYYFTVTSIGEQAFKYGYVNNISIPNSITSIGDYAFEGCGLNGTDIPFDLPNSITSIGEGAFSSCLFSTITIPESVKEIKAGTFENCHYLTSITLQNINSIGNYAFVNCGSLMNVTLSNVQSIGNYAFNSIPRTAIIKFTDATPPTIDSNSFMEGSIFIVPDNAKSAYENALSNANGFILANGEIPQNIDETITDYEFNITAIKNGSALKYELLKSVGFNYAHIQKLKLSGTLNKDDLSIIKGLNNLTHIDISDATIGSNVLQPYAFSRLSKLESVALPNNITEIGYDAFSSCTSLQSVGDISAVTQIGSSAFYNCYSLKSIGDMPALTNIGSSAFSDCRALQSIGNMPALTDIGSCAFYNCRALQSIGNMPSLTDIKYRAFYNCSALESIGEMPQLASVGEAAFYYNNGLLELFLPETLTSVETSAFTSPTLVHFAGITPPSFSGSTISTFINVPEESVEAYQQALPNMPVANIFGGPTSFDVAVSAKENDSDILNKINNGGNTDKSHNVFNLKVSGTINSYDIMVMRNKMINLRKLDLSDAVITASSYEYYTGCHTENNVIGNNMFREMKLYKLILPYNIVSIGDYAFYRCSKLTDIIIPKQVESIGHDAFMYCSQLTNAILPEKLKSLGGSAFRSCSSLREIKLPPTLTSIPEYCFSSCSNLTEFRIPTSVTKIGNSAIPGSVRNVYTYTIQPTAIGQNTFDSDTYLKATLHVPETSEKLYYWDTQWSQFQSITNFNEPYSYFYLTDKDLIEDPDTPRLNGETDPETGDKKNPDADLGEGSGLVVDGDDSQDLGNVDLDHNGKENGATIIGGNSSTSESGGNVNIDMLNIKISVVAKKWYFFTFPFDIELSNIKFNGQMVWRYYDGEWRAMHGSGSWKDMKGEKLERGRGYIFQGSKAGTLTLSIPNASFNANDWKQRLEQFVSVNPEDASWNFIGNPFQSYYELADLGFEGPITWWNSNTNSYEAFSPLDDDLSMYPFMAFFVQKPEGVDEAEFFGEYRETNNQKNDPNHRAAARKRRLARRARAAADRMLVNLTVTDGTYGDRTRIVFNDQASEAYEVGVDASKFVSGEAPQIYSLDAKNVRYAINERPAGDGIVRLGFYAPASGIFTIGCQRNDCPVTLKDCLTGMTVELTEGATYEFTAEQGYDDARFVINGAGQSSIESVEGAEPADATYYRINGIETNGSQRGVMIEVKGNEATKVIRK